MKKDKIVLRVAAKINLTLDITGITDDGYHSLDTIMASVGIYDKITVVASDSVRVTMKGIVNDETNTAFKAVKLAVERFGIGGADVAVEKGIPFSSGLGGSSADISGTLYGIGKLYGIPDNDIKALAAELGSDTVFMLDGGMAECTGRGNDLKKIEITPLNVLLIKPKGGANTASVFKEYDRQSRNVKTAFTEGYLSHDNKDRLRYIGNALTQAACAVNPNIASAIARLKDYTDVYSMSGSGSAAFGIFEDIDVMERAVNDLRRDYRFAAATKIIDKGITVY